MPAPSPANARRGFGRRGRAIHCLLKKIRLATLLGIVLALACAGVARAHARLLRSNPEDGAVLVEPPAEVFLWFDEPIAAEFSQVELLDSRGQSLGKASLSIDASDPTLVVAALPLVTEEVVTVAWEVLSNTDSHVTRGTLVLAIGQRASVPPRQPATTQASIALLEIALRAATYATLAVIIGSLVVGGLILRGLTPEEATREARRRNRWLGFGAAVLALAVGIAWLGWQSTILGRGPFEGLLATRFGLLWLARQGLLVVILGALAVGGRTRWGGWVAVSAVAALAVLQALTGHAAGLAQAAALAVTVAALHLLAAGAWIGSLVALLVALWPLLRSRSPEWRAAASAGWRKFGMVALASVGTLGATGLYNAARQVASVDAWLATLYGQVLAAKISLFVIVGLAGVTNSVLLHPTLRAVLAKALRRPEGWTPVSPRRLPAILLTEMVLGSLVFVGSGALLAAPPARGPEFEPVREAPKPPSSLTLSADDLLVTLAIRPNKPGLNLLTVAAANTRRPAPAEILRVLVRLKYQERELGSETLILEAGEPGSYRLSTRALTFAGAWRAQVVVRRKGMEDSVADFAWQVEALAPAVPARPVVVSNAPLGPALALLGAGLGAATALAVAWLALRIRRSRPGESERAAAVDYRHPWTNPSS